MAHPVYCKLDIEKVEVTHLKPTKFRDHFAYAYVSVLRKCFDLASWYNPPKMNENQWMVRILLLETIAGVPGMVGGMGRHLRSIRTLQRDHGWIHHLLEEAENERMHLFTFLAVQQPGILMRIMIVLSQGVFFNFYFISYILFPKYSHRFVGYLEE